MLQLQGSNRDILSSGWRRVAGFETIGEEHLRFKEELGFWFLEETRLIITIIIYIRSIFNENKYL